jgi:VanZ family protein
VADAADLSAPSGSTSPSAAVLPRFRRAIGWTLAVYWTALFIGTHMPLPQLKEMPRFSDKVMHFGAYAGLAFLLGLWRSARRGYARGVPWTILLVVALYGVADELLQIPVNRSAEVADFTADMLGGMLGLVSLIPIQGYLRRFFISAVIPSRDVT